MGGQDSIADILAELKRSSSPSEVIPMQLPQPAVADIDSLLVELNLAPASQGQAPIEAILQKVKQGDFMPSAFTIAVASQGAQNFIAYELQEVSQELDRELRQREQEQRQEQEKLAQEWLNQLDWLSGEGIWFEKFAKNYDSHRSAAIAYLFSQ